MVAGEDEPTETETMTVDECITLKQHAIADCITESFGRTPGRLHLLSVGDSAIEQEAAQDVARCWRQDLRDGACHVEPLCKTVKFMDMPSLEELRDELHELTECFTKLAEW